MANLTALAETVKAKKAEIAAVLKEAGEREIKAALRDLFTAHADLKAVRWRQYTPHFNDGDACVFTVHGVEYLKTDGDEDGDWDDVWGKPKDELTAALKEFSGALRSLDDGMEDVFGDHKQITCTREAIEVEEYEHD